jgi:hypothetical protein
MVISDMLATPALVGSIPADIATVTGVFVWPAVVLVALVLKLAIARLHGLPVVRGYLAPKNGG